MDMKHWWQQETETLGDQVIPAPLCLSRIPDRPAWNWTCGSTVTAPRDTSRPLMLWSSLEWAQGKKAADITDMPASNAQIINSCLLIMLEQVEYISFRFVSFRSPSLFCLLTAGVEVVYFHLITLRHTTVGRTPLDKGSARRRDLYLTTQTQYKRQTSMPPVGFEPTIPASAPPQTHALDRSTTGIGWIYAGWNVSCGNASGWSPLFPVWQLH
jgi:hypothetical protein